MRLRLRFAKRGKVRFTSHRDVARMWERAFRRTELRLAYTEGFSPRPRVSFGLALPTGHESEAEYLDLELADAELAPELLSGLLPRLSAALPEGVEVTAGVVIDDRAASLQEEVTSCTWRVEVTGADAHAEDAEAVARRVLAADSLIATRMRKGREVVDDLRPAVVSLTACGPGELECELLTQPRGVRPAELLAACGVEAGKVWRMHQWIERPGARYEPEAAGLPFRATGAPHAEARAS